MKKNLVNYKKKITFGYKFKHDRHEKMIEFFFSQKTIILIIIQNNINIFVFVSDQKTEISKNV